LFFTGFFVGGAEFEWNARRTIVSFAGSQQTDRSVIQCVVVSL
jgi:hypothetical protein